MIIEQTLAERGERYGSFEHHAEIAQGIQDEFRKHGGWQRLAPDQKQALTVIADKIARMLNGDPNYRDNWHDIVGYAKLVDDRLLRDEQPARPALFVKQFVSDEERQEAVDSMRAGYVFRFPDKPGQVWRLLEAVGLKGMFELVTDTQPEIGKV